MITTRFVKIVDGIEVANGESIIMGFNLGQRGAKGDKGDKGDDGADGSGVPPGGLYNQVLGKSSDLDYDVRWVDQTGGGSNSPIETISVNDDQVLIVNKNVNIVVPTKTSELDNDSYFVSDSNYSSVKSKAESAIQTELDPTVPPWAKTAAKPTYTAAEVNAQPVLGFTPENINNKKITLTSSDAYYPTSKAVVDALYLKSNTTHNHNLSDLSEKSYNSLSDLPNLSLLEDVVDIQYWVNDINPIPLDPQDGAILYNTDHPTHISSYIDGQFILIDFQWKLYINKDSNSDLYGKVYIYNGTELFLIPDALALGTTHDTAGYGDDTSEAVSHARITNGNPHGTSVTDIGAAPALTSDQNYVSDTELSVLQNTSGVNTGDQDLSGKSDTSHTHTGIYSSLLMNVLTAGAGASEYTLLRNIQTNILNALPSGVNSTITIPTPVAGELNESVLHFSTGAVIPTLVYNGFTPVWLGTSTLSLKINKTYTVCFEQVRTATNTWTVKTSWGEY